MKLAESGESEAVECRYAEYDRGSRELAGVDPTSPPRKSPGPSACAIPRAIMRAPRSRSRRQPAAAGNCNSVGELAPLTAKD